MSKDNTIIVWNFPEWYRVINSQACENLNSNEYVYHYFKDTTPIEYIDDAVNEANRMEEEDLTEYWIMHIDFPLSLKDYKKLHIGHSISNAVDCTFQNDVMGAMEYHKNSDGIINFQYNYYVDERTILHNWYTRWEIMCTETDLERASHNYCAYIQEANNKELEYRDKELNEQLPNDWHIKIDQDSYELYYKWDICVLGSIRDWRRNNVLEYIQEYKI